MLSHKEIQILNTTFYIEIDICINKELYKNYTQ